MSPRNWGDDDATRDVDGSVVIAYVFMILWGVLIGWIAHMALM